MERGGRERGGGRVEEEGREYYDTQVHNNKQGLIN